MKVTITRKTLALALLYVEGRAKNIQTIKSNGLWTVTATY